MSQIPPTRASLILRLRDPRDATAWGDFVALYGPLVYGFARRQGLQDADAADLVQDVLGAVAGAVGRLEYDPRRGAFRNWLFTVVRRKLANWRRDGRNRSTNAKLEEHPAPDGAEPDWEAEWQGRVFACACEQVRREVSADTWQAFWRTAVDGQRGRLVAAELGLTVVAVYHARSRVQARLKELVRAIEKSEGVLDGPIEETP